MKCRLCGGFMNLVRIMWCGKMQDRYKCIECGFIA